MSIVILGDETAQLEMPIKLLIAVVIGVVCLGVALTLVPKWNINQFSIEVQPNKLGPSGGKVEIKVSDADTGNPVESAIVSLSGCGFSAADITGQQGQRTFTISNIKLSAGDSYGIIKVKVEKSGYQTGTAEILVST